MDNSVHRSFGLPDHTYVATAKREIRQMAIRLDFPARKIAELDIILAELASNLIKYATGGELLVRAMPDSLNAGIELISVDRGPGMTDPNRMLADGMTTGGSLGQGLGAINRLADEFQLYSLPGWGTVVLVRLFKNLPEKPSAVPKATVRWIIVPKPGQTDCGDGCYVKQTTSALTVFLGDGLGHGSLAQTAIRQAVQTLAQHRAGSPAAMLTAIHGAIVGTRGLVGTCAVFDFTSRKWTLCGVGNITTQLSGSMGTKGYIAQNGIIGYSMPRTLLDQTMNYERGQQLILTSDGLQSRWNPARYPNISSYDPSVLAAIIYKEYARHTDDMSVLVSRIH